MSGNFLGGYKINSQILALTTIIYSNIYKNNRKENYYEQHKNAI